MKLRPFRNPLLLMNRAGHRVFQSVRSDTLAYSPGSLGACFEIVSMEVGQVSPERWVICFNAPADSSCQDATNFVPFILGDGGFDNKSAHPSTVGDPRCIEINTDNGPASPSVGPNDDTYIFYSGGTCHREGTTGDPDCELADLPATPVTNNVYGPDTVRIGDVSDDLLIATFPTPLATVGSDWKVDVNASPVTTDGGAVVGGALHITLDSPVSNTDVVTLTHNAQLPWTTAAIAADGRICWRFFDMPVLNVVGVGFWNREDAGPWLLEPKTGKWKLEGG